MNEHRQHWLLDEGTIFLNHGSFGACPRVVLEAQARLRAQLERQPLRFMLRELPALREQARARLAALVGGEVEGLVFVPNATTAVNAILRSLDLRPGDELLSHSQAYNACNNALRFVAERSGAKVVTVDLPFPLDDDVDLVEQDGRLSVVFAGGATQPLHVRVARRRGQLRSALGELGVDLLEVLRLLAGERDERLDDLRGLTAEAAEQPERALSGLQLAVRVITQQPVEIGLRGLYPARVGGLQ